MAAAAYDDAVQELARVPLARFVAERKRLASALRAARKAELGARLEKRRKPPAAAWAVNQLWWQARDAFERMLATAARLRRGELDAARAHHAAAGALRERAASILRDAGHGASDATLRRVATTLAALAAAGGFAPDPPGALEDDREAPGFAALGLAGDPDDERGAERAVPAPTRSRAPKATCAPRKSPRPTAAERAREKRLAAAERRRQREERQAERTRERERRAKLRAERVQLERALDAAVRAERACERETTALEEKAAAARETLAAARARTLAAQRALASTEPMD